MAAQGSPAVSPAVHAGDDKDRIWMEGVVPVGRFSLGARERARPVGLLSVQVYCQDLFSLW